MFVNELFQEVESWEFDSLPIIKVPLREQTLSRSKAYRQIRLLAELFATSNGERKLVVGLCFDDPKTWVLSIIGAQLSRVVTVPIPREFTLRQVSSFVPNLDIVLTDSEELAQRMRTLLCESVSIERIPFNDAHIFFLDARQQKRSTPDLPAEAVCVIHTSGSTDNPKGVVISEQGLQNVVRSMRDRMDNLGSIHYASVLPMSLLLEQVLGIFIPVFTKGSVSILPPTIGCYTGTQTDLVPYFDTIRSSRSNFSMLPPSFLTELCKRSKSFSTSARSYLGPDLRVLATGGAPIESSTLDELKRNGLDVFQGYGLSENTSVVAWTYPDSNVLGSVGRPLEHNQVRINAQGEIEVSGTSVFVGYVSNGAFLPKNDAWLNTGDKGYFDEDGCLYVTGRDSNLIVLSSGRNVSPEWIEGKFRSIPSVKDVLVLGHGKPFLSALVLVNKGYTCAEALDETERFSEQMKNELPEFSRVQAFRALPFDDRCYSVSGRILRRQVLESQTAVIDEIYSTVNV